jgi:serum/glucocorticoid-regulated kinase 2
LSLSPGPENANEKKYDWTLIWQREDTRFYFYNDFTRSKRSMISNQGKRSRNLQGSAACAYDAPDANTDNCLPDAAQCQEALEAVLENQYMHMIPALLKEYSIGLNINHNFARTTPINYVAELEDAETVRLFLENGANANLNHGHTMGGQPLLTAVKKGNPRAYRKTCSIYGPHTLH